MKYTIDAQGKKLGRVASEAAAILRGKHSVSFTRNELPETAVEVINVSKIAIAAKKSEQTRYSRYSGYPGGLKHVSMKQCIEKRGHGELLRKVILGMLPRNRMRSRLIKRLTVAN